MIPRPASNDIAAADIEKCLETQQGGFDLELLFTGAA
jgi:hypothetical protein